MKAGTKVKVNLNFNDAKKLGINGSVVGIGEITGTYPSNVPGHYVRVNGKNLAIADKYNALTEIKG